MLLEEIFCSVIEPVGSRRCTIWNVFVPSGDPQASPCVFV